MRFNEIPSPAGQNSQQPQRPPLMLFGDPHGDFKPVIRAVQRYKPEAIILLGDLTRDRPLHVKPADIVDLTEIWFIHGNHDSDALDYRENLTTRLEGTPLAGRNLHGRVARVAGLQVAGLGGIFRGAVWYPQTSSNEPAKFASPEALRRLQAPGTRIVCNPRGYPRSRVLGPEMGFENREFDLARIVEV